eukprot:210376_1
MSLSIIRHVQVGNHPHPLNLLRRAVGGIFQSSSASARSFLSPISVSTRLIEPPQQQPQPQQPQPQPQQQPQQQPQNSIDAMLHGLKELLNEFIQDTDNQFDQLLQNCKKQINEEF